MPKPGRGMNETLVFILQNKSCLKKMVVLDLPEAAQQSH